MNTWSRRVAAAGTALAAAVSVSIATAPTATAADRCIGPVHIGTKPETTRNTDPNGLQTDIPTQRYYQDRVQIWRDIGQLPDGSCPGLTATFIDPHGATVNVSLDSFSTTTDDTGAAFNLTSGYLWLDNTKVGLWKLTTVHVGTNAYNQNLSFHVYRPSQVTVAAESPPNMPATISGTVTEEVRFESYQPGSGRVVHFRTRDSAGKITTLSTTATTNSSGAYKVTVPHIPDGVYVAALVSSSAEAKWAGSAWDYPDHRQKTFLDGRTAPTSTTTACAGCTMSTYGHLKLGYMTGKIGPYANQTVEVQVRVNGGSTWQTVATSGPTTSTGYFITRWKVDYLRGTAMDTRIAFSSQHPTLVSGTVLSTGRFVVP